ncbi:MAG: glycerate kinase [Candidatus Peregrinibacteria bacterium]
MIQNQRQLIQNGSNPKEKKIRKDLLTILESVLNAIDPYRLTRQFWPKLKLKPQRYKNIYVVGAGKAVYKMALAVESVLGKRIKAGFINIPSLPEKNELKIIQINQARHPTPDARGVRGSKKIRNIVKKACSDDLVLVVMSGGGSSLMPLPVEGVPLKDKIKLFSMMLKTPARIHEINVVRKHLSQIKGGQLAALAHPATVIAIYISDIIDDPFDIQASGPTAPDPSTHAEAISILKKHHLWSKAPCSIQRHLTRGVRGLVLDTPDHRHKTFTQGKIHNFTIGNHRTAVKAATQQAQKMGYNVLPLTSSLEGEAKEVAKMIVSVGKEIQRHAKPIKTPAIVIAGGETTVHVRGTGKGGRNQELALAGLQVLQPGMTLVSFGTDGIDGMTPKPVAGAIADVSTRERAVRLKLDLQAFLSNNDSYHFFNKVKDHIVTGPSGTNVGDLILLALS